MAIDYKQLGRNVQAIRKKRKLTQQGLADLLNYSPEHISQLEHGNRPIQLDALNQICEDLNVSFGELLFGATPALITPKEEHASEEADAITEFSALIHGCSQKRIENMLSVCRILANFPR